MQRARAIATLLATRKLTWEFPGLYGDAYFFAVMHRQSFSLGALGFTGPNRGNGAVLQNCEMRKQVKMLEHHAHLAAHGVDIARIVG